MDTLYGDVHLMLTKFIQVFASVNEQQPMEPFTVVVFLCVFFCFFLFFFFFFFGRGDWLIEMRYEKKKNRRIYSIFSIS